MMKSGIENKLKFLHAHYGILEFIFTTRFSFGFWHKITNSLTKMTFFGPMGMGFQKKSLWRIYFNDMYMKR